MSDKSPEAILSFYAGATARRGEPVVIGVPLPRKGVTDVQQLQVLDDQSNHVRADVTVLDRWPDNSIRWVLLAFRAQSHNPQTHFSLSAAADRRGFQTSPNNSPLHVQQKDGGFTIETGPTTFTVGPGDGWPIRRICTANGDDWLAGASNGLYVTLGDGSSPPCQTQHLSLEACGAVRAVVKCCGIAPLTQRKRLEIVWRLEFFAALPIVIVHLTIRNPHRAKHPDGYWELGDPGSQVIRGAAFKLYPRGSLAATHAWCSAAPNLPQHPVEVPFEIYQDSSGGENWRSTNHVNREGRVPVSFRGYSCSDETVIDGYRATPIVALETSLGSVALASRHFWQNFPKALEVNESGISYGLFPHQWNDLHEIQGGEQKTHSFAVSFGNDDITDLPLDWFRQPLVPTLDPAWVAETGAVPYLTPADSDPHRQYLELVNAAIEGNDTFKNKREIIDEYGWRHFGDIYGDHETVYAQDFRGPGPLVSHYNNQYDPIAGFCFQWLRSGDPRWWSQFNELAAHVVDIDTYHTDEDKAAYNHGLFWHTYHYVEAGLSTHRSYPRIGKSNGGGPANEHIYTTGLMLHYFLTGNQSSRDTAIAFAQFIIDIDDGSKTLFRWLARGHTGLASVSRSADYHGPGRGAGNSLNALIDGHRLSGTQAFLDKAEQIICRVSHPEDNIARLTLLDAENRWFYTMFLQALGKYLDHKADLGQCDSMYAYARATLLHYARWMKENEHPFLEKPEILEYPTETWAAQDMRKSEVFQYAWLHASHCEREHFKERATYFFRYAVSTLATHKTQSLCRPVVLLLAFGWMQAWILGHADATRPEPDQSSSSWVPQKIFVPQKAQALSRAKLAAAAAALIFLGTAIAIAITFR